MPRQHAKYSDEILAQGLEVLSEHEMSWDTSTTRIYKHSMMAGCIEGDGWSKSGGGTKTIQKYWNPEILENGFCWNGWILDPMSKWCIDSMSIIVLDSMSIEAINGAMVEGQGMKVKWWNWEMEFGPSENLKILEISTRVFYRKFECQMVEWCNGTWTIPKSRISEKRAFSKMLNVKLLDVEPRHDGILTLRQKGICEVDGHVSMTWVPHIMKS